ncbi:MAG: TRAP transporter small permease [Erysipelotrichia bacterium]|nr:TRAP transporter small permease [Erysipelotrichia bacterium]
MIFMKAFYYLLEKISTFFSLVGAILSVVVMFAMTVHIIYEIILRAFFDSSTYVLDEMVGYGVAAMIFLSLGYAFKHKSLIRVSILSTSLESERLKTYLEVFCVVVGIFASAFIFKYFYLSIVRHLARGSKSETIAEVPLWIPELFVCIGLAIFMLELIRRFFGLILNQEESVMISAEAE